VAAFGWRAVYLGRVPIAAIALGLTPVLRGGSQPVPAPLLARDHDKELTIPNTWRFDIGSHINARGQRPRGEQREPTVRCSGKFGAITTPT